MIEQPALWNGPSQSALPQTRPTSRRTDHDTAHDAAALAMVDAPTLRERCLAALREHGPLTDHELAAIVGRQQTSCGKRRLELCEAGLAMQAFDSLGRPLRRPTPSGASALVWRAT